MIVAHSLNGVIGQEGRIPWHLPTDMEFFRRTTYGHTVIMGRRTFESIGRPLPGRRNVVLSQNPDFHAEGIEVFTSVEQLDADLTKGSRSDDQVFIIGGQEIYSLFLKRATVVYLTIVDTVVDGDAFFPRLSGSWHVTLLEEHRLQPERDLRGEWYPHRMYRVESGRYEKS